MILSSQADKGYQPFFAKGSEIFEIANMDSLFIELKLLFIIVNSDTWVNGCSVTGWLATQHRQGRASLQDWAGSSRSPACKAVILNSGVSAELFI